MADQVQATLDRMVPALRDLLDRGIFTESEINAIVASRRESEYLVRRIAPRKADYQRYIASEKNLEKLRKLRKKMVLARQEAKEREEKHGDNNGGDDGDKKENNKGNPKSTFGDTSIVQNIHFLYVRAKRKWKEDLSWHLQHAEFAKEVKSYQMLSRIYAEALQIHPRNESLWIEAASHEYFGYVTDENKEGDEMTEGGGSIKSARVLLQRGLRINPTAKALWLQSFCLELHYIQKLKGRREILQLQTESASNIKRSDDDEHEPQVKNTLKLPMIIYKNAIKAVPDDASFRLQFIEQCKLFPQTQPLSDFVMDSIETDFQNVEEVWIARAQLTLQNDQSSLVENHDGTTRKRKRNDNSDERDEKVLQILLEATDAISTTKMYLLCLEFLRNFFAKICTSLDDSDRGDDMALAKKRMMNVIEFTVQFVNKAETAVSMTPELAIAMASCLIEFGLSTQALKLMKSLMYGNPKCKKESKCWLMIAEISETEGMNEQGDKNIKASCKVLRNALNWVPLHDCGHVLILSKLFMSLLSGSNASSSKNELILIYEKILLLYHQVKEDTEISLPSITLAFIRFAANDVSLIRQIYKKSLLNSYFREIASTNDDDVDIMRENFDECILAETEQLKLVEVGSKNRKRQIYNLLSLNDAACTYFLLVNGKLAHTYNQRKVELSGQLLNLK